MLFDSSVATPVGLACHRSKALPAARVTVEAAQGTPVVCVPGLLGTAEVAAIHSFAVAAKKTCGSVVRQVDDVTNTACWRTTYLSTDDAFALALPAVLEKVVAAAVAVGRDILGVAAGASLQPRVVEYHDVRVGGKLAQAHHYDSGSVLTVDVMLSRVGEDFQGGNFLAAPFQTLAGEPADAAFLALGDAVVFLSHKYHNVAPVRRGKRRVLIIELWDGQRRTCAHRCELASGPCAVRR